MTRVLFILGTRPEAIKLCPVIERMRQDGRLEARVCVTAQHREMLDQVLQAFQIPADYDLNVMAPGQSLFDSTSLILAGLSSVLREPFDWIVVQGDTTTTLCGSLAGFYARIRVAHVEAGLRTGNPASPFPEEMNRVLTTRLASLHFAATEGAAANLRGEGVSSEVIRVTGNTVIDAVHRTSQALSRGELQCDGWPWLNPSRRLILVTAHRRENFGGPIASVCRALVRLSRRPDVQIAFPVHLNPNVRNVVAEHLQDRPNITLLEPQNYVPFVDLMRRSFLVLTDSGGIQEEAPSLGKPVLVLRENTERPEAIESGVAKLVGTLEDRIVYEAETLLDNRAAYEQMAQKANPYGDGQASDRIVEELHRQST